jgi:uncharacterized protein YwgA
MNRNQILLSLVLDAADVPVRVDDFDHRLMLQKAVYLLQQGGVEFGYPYSWYIRGPYSSRLADDVFAIAGVGADEKAQLKSYALGEKTRAVVEKVKSLLATTDAGLPRPRHWELLASVLFLVRTGQAPADDAERLSQILKINKKQFEPSDAERAVAHLRQNGYPL